MDDTDRGVVDGLSVKLARLEDRVYLLQLVACLALVLAVVLPIAAILVGYDTGR